MPTRQARPTIPTPKGRPLSEVLSALTSEFARAAVSRDLSEAQWREIYQNHAALADLTPSRVRVVTAKVSLPVAVEDISTATVQDTGITPRQIATVLGNRFSPQERQQLAAHIHAQLVAKSKQHYLNRTLVTDLKRIAAKTVPGFNLKQDLDLARVTKIQQDFITQPPRESVTRFLYAAADLEQLRPESIIRLELTIGID
jgi:hypothetical protein